jgi:serine/threonine protein kinase
MYMEYCPYGDLGKILEHHRNINQHVPEPLIWHIFESLVNAGLLMEQGGVDQPRAGWTRILHRDFKPQNAFLGLHPDPASGRNDWAAYPTIKLGDYGLAVEALPQDDRNPFNFVDAGTPGYQAPEQIDDPDDDDPPPLTAKTNVFGVGITVMQLMDPFHHVGVQDDWAAARAGSRDPADFPHLNAQAAANYSSELLNRIYACVEYGQNDRPSFSHARDAIRYYTQGQGGSPQNDRAQGMRANTVQQTVNLGLAPDMYAHGRPLGQVNIPALPVLPLDFDSDGNDSDNEDGQEDGDNEDDDDEEEDGQDDEEEDED